MQNTIERKYAKKLWAHILRMRNAGCMNEVQTILNDAIIDFFNVRHLGILKIRMERAGQGHLFEEVKSFRMARMKDGAADIKSYLSSFVPARMANSIMYKNTFVSPI